MTPALVCDAGPSWRDLLVPGRRYVALPSWNRPVVVAELDRRVLDYVRHALLAAPPRSGLPAWVYTTAGCALRAPAAWWPFARTAAPVDGQHRPSALQEFLADGDHRVVVLCHDRGVGAGCVLLGFAPGARLPRLAVKLGGANTSPRIGREAARLAAVERVAGPVLGTTLPRVLGVLDHRGRAALVTTAHAGVSMFVRYHRPGHTADPAAVRADLDAAARWLTRVQSVPAGPARPLDLPEETLARLHARLPGEPDSERLLDRLGPLQSRLRRHTAPATLVHGDFWPGNVLVDEGEVTGVVDWEHAETAGSPVRDLARFALAYSAYLDRHTRPGRQVAGHPALVAGPASAGSVYGIDGRGWFPDAIRRFLFEGLSRLGLPAACGRDVLLSEVAGLLAETQDPRFADEQRATFLALGDAA